MAASETTQDVRISAVGLTASVAVEVMRSVAAVKQRVLSMTRTKNLCGAGIASRREMQDNIWSGQFTLAGVVQASIIGRETSVAEVCDAKCGRLDD